MLNQNRFWSEIKSILNLDDSKDIEGTTFEFKMNSSSDMKQGTLDLYDNGLYLLSMSSKRLLGLASESENEEFDITHVEHCGVWDYQGDEIMMEGLGTEVVDVDNHRVHVIKQNGQFAQIDRRVKRFTMSLFIRHCSECKRGWLYEDLSVEVYL